MKNMESENFLNQKMINDEAEAKYITYGELTQKVGTMLLCNEIDERYRNFIDTKYKHSNEISQEEINLLLNTYQWYIITNEAAEYLQKETDEAVYYDKELNVYAWGIGTDDMNTDWRNEPSTVKAE
ncbi:hypothetical protein D7V82_19875 [bacterium 1xD8-6]|nr:hypothetical protein [Lachnospiraceae bacterium]RKI25520.1 hypothetical protein D7V72_14720 [bacterium D16-36]RKI63647.1 hypothetical protein D7V82_19875 [bacterium 1xD8-6]